MDFNGNDAKTKPLISSMKPQKEEEGEERELSKEGEDGDDDESKRLLSPRNGTKAPKTRRKVQWNDTNGKRLAEVLEFQPSEASDSDDDDESDSCLCTIM